MTIKTKRLTPSPKTLRALYLRSGNLCAHPKCETILITKRGIMIGEVCHIEAAEEGGPRFNASMTNEQRSAQSNLMLLCSNHHTLVDRDTKTYTVSTLKKMKDAHEGKFSEIADTLKQRFETQIKDHTDDTQATPASNFRTFLEHCGYEVPTGEIKVGLAKVADYARRLGNLPDGDREFMAALVKRALKLDPNCGGVSLDVHDLEGAMKLGAARIKRYSHVLEHHDLGGLFERDYNKWFFELNDPWDFAAWPDIARYAEKRQLSLDEFVLKVQFHLLD